VAGWRTKARIFDVRERSGENFRRAVAVGGMIRPAASAVRWMNKALVRNAPALKMKLAPQRQL